MSMQFDFDESVRKWISLIRSKNAVLFGEEELDQELFHNAMLDAVHYFKELMDHKGSTDEHITVWDYLTLVKCMAEYAADCFIGDESKECIFTASQIAVSCLLDEAVYGWEDAFQSPILFVDKVNYNAAERRYEYNVETGDLSDFMVLAKRMNVI